MGSQPSSFSSNREFKGFIVTKQLSVRHKINLSLSKKFSNSEVLTIVEYDAIDHFGKSKRSNQITIKRPHSEKIKILQHISYVSEVDSVDVKNLKTKPVAVTKLPKIDPKSNQTVSKKVSDQSLFETTKFSKSEKAENCLKLVDINQRKEVTMNKNQLSKNVESFEHLDHWIQKNEPYIEVSDVNTHNPDENEEVEAEGDENDEEQAEDASAPQKDFETQKAEFIEKLRKKMKDLKQCQDDRTTEGYIADDLRQLILNVYNSYFHFKKKSLQKRMEARLHVAEEILRPEHETLVIFCKISSSILQNGYRNSEGKAVAALFKPLKNMLAFLQNITDTMHPGVAKMLLDQTDFMKLLMKKLNEWIEQHMKKEIKDNDNILCGVAMGIIHNLIQVEEFVPRLRELGVIETVKPYLESDFDTRRLLSLSILANVADEAESEMISSNSNSIAFLIKRLEKAMRSKIRRCAGWSVREITRAIRMVAKNEANKRLLVTHGALPLLVEIAEKPKNIEEQKEAVGALWTLSFDKQNQEEIINDKDLGVIDICVKLYESAEDSSVKKTCGKALWTMRDKLKASEHYKNVGEKFSLPQTPREKDKAETHVMVSYNWGHQEIVKQIVKILRNNGIKVWMDIDDMQGSTLQAMATAVEKSEIVLVCYSHKYKNSDNCRAEAEYAFQLKKKIIPLRMEAGYKGDGWLGFIIGAKLFYDFSGKYSFENKIAELLKDIQSSLHNTERPVVLQPEVKVQVSPVVQARPVVASSKVTASNDIEKVKKWTPQHVGKWLDKNSLPRNLLGRLSGLEIAFLHILVQESPDMYYKTIGEQLGVKDILTMAKLRFALEAFDISI